MEMNPTKKSKQMFERAQQSLAGGVGSKARSVHAGFTPYPIFMDHGEGSRIFDVDGNEYIDYLLALGPLILGHKPKKIIEAVKDAMENYGPIIGTPYELEYEATEMLCKAVPCVELARFGSSGSEVVMSAIRLARAYTGKEKIIRFEGHYHGQADTVNFKITTPLEYVESKAVLPSAPVTPGIPECLSGTVIILPWNDPEIVESTIEKHKNEIACLITEPVMCNCGCILPKPGYLEFLRDITSKNNILLIFDEVITSFRLSSGGAQEYYSVIPDLAIFAKALGAGFPVAAFGGRREIMELIANDKVSQGGTYNSNPIAMAAVKATLNELTNNKDIYTHLFSIGDRVSQGLEKVLRNAGVSCFAQGVGPIFQIWFAEKVISNYREAIAFSMPKQYHAFNRAMLRRGVLFHPAQMENCFVSTSHTNQDVELTLQIAEDAIIEAKKPHYEHT